MSLLENMQQPYGSENTAETENSRTPDERVKPREFFWDNIVLFVVSSIIGLAAIDVVTEYIRGSEVSCFSPLGNDLTEAQGEYINSYCAGHLPYGAYIPAFMVIHAILLTIPHKLWQSHYGGNFDFFFSLSSSLKRSREEGEHVQENLGIVRQLEDTFGTYARKSIFAFYKLKLAVQLLWSIAGIVFACIYFFSHFGSNFSCPGDFNSTVYPFWPLDTDVACVFETLSLLQTLWLAEIGLLGIACFSLFWALLWCWSSHVTELGAVRVALFSFQSGLSPKFYTGSFHQGQQFWQCFFSRPRIETDVDFLLMKLYRTDNGLGHVFKEVQIESELKILANDDQRRLRFHSYIQEKYTADNVNEASLKSLRAIRDRVFDEQDLKWKFTKDARKDGAYCEFMMLPHNQQLVLTNTMRGAVLGFGQRAPHNDNALTVSFGDVGYGTALSRVFIRVGSLNFNPAFSISDVDDVNDVVKVVNYSSFNVSIIAPDTILSTHTKHVNKFVESLRTIWVPPGAYSQFGATGYIVVGPIPKEHNFNITNLHLLFKEIYGCLEPGAVLLTIHPLEIGGTFVGNDFISYEPTAPHFEPLRQEHPCLCTDETVREWPARRSYLNSTTQVTLPSQSCNQLPYQFVLDLMCGSTKTVVEFSTYYYTNAEQIPRPRAFDAPTRRRQKISMNRN